MFQDVCICADYDEVCDVWHERWVVGRKPHRCCECLRKIPKGVRHQVVTMLFDGRWDRYRTCELCVAVAKDFMSCGRLVGGLWEMLAEALDDFEGNGWLEPPRHPIEVR